MKKEDLQIKIGLRVIELREKKGWSQADLARECNRERQFIERIESGRYNSTISSLAEVAEGLGVSLSEVVRM